jgi:hypothetical protein
MHPSFVAIDNEFIEIAQEAEQEVRAFLSRTSTKGSRGTDPSDPTTSIRSEP